MDNVDKAACKAKGIEVMNTPKASSVAVAELAMALMLAVPNRLIEAHNGMKEGKFLKNELKRTELYKKTLGLLGIGRIGTEVAKRAAAFGMKVIAYDPFVKSHDVAKLVPASTSCSPGRLHQLHTPLTDETRGMINKDAIAKMKKGVIIVNTGRGKCVVEAGPGRGAEARQGGRLRHRRLDSRPAGPRTARCSRRRTCS